VPEISVKDQIRRIVELQRIDGEIYNLKLELEEKPAVLEQLKEQFELSKGALAELEGKAKGIQVDRKEKELELKTQEEKIAQANTQLSQIKDNKEYKAKISEIEHIKADQSIIEEKILVSYDESDVVNAEVEKEKVKAEAKEKDYLAKKKEAEESIKLIEDRVKVLNSQRKQALTDIDSSYLNRYDRILKHKEGTAIVPVQGGGTCSGCFMNLTSQQINAIKMHDQLVECQTCSRILYFEDDI